MNRKICGTLAASISQGHPGFSDLTRIRLGITTLGEIGYRGSKVLVCSD